MLYIGPMDRRPIIWRPSQELIAHANITRFMRAHGIADYPAVLQRSVADIRWFWDAALKDLGVVWTRPYSSILDDSHGFPFTTWFVGGELNIVANAIDRHVAARGAQLALVGVCENGEERTYTFAELAAAVARCANVLQSLGAGRGEAVALFMPMIPEVAIAMFACMKIGAVAVPIFAGFGVDALVARLDDARVRVVVTTDGGIRKGKGTPVKATVDAAATRVASVQHVVVYRRGLEDISWHARDLWWHEVNAQQSARCDTVALPSEHPCLILYTSGTTGKPKGCVHTHGGALAQIAKELGYHFDVKPGDRFFWVTDIGWMMGPWELTGALFHGATVVLYEGMPDVPHPDRLWQICDAWNVTHLGISPTAVRVLKRAGDAWVSRHPMQSLRILGSTGEPWDPESYLWFFEKVGRARCPVINISGGTEIIGCHLAPLPIHPLKPCTLQGPGLGMDIAVFNEAGESVRGEIGYLVCKQPAPSMTRGFLNDRQRYLETYFSTWPAVWNHGDWASVDDEGFWFLHGRADDTIKVAGKRVGPAEIEAALLDHPAVAEAAAIGVPDELKGESIVCFVVMKSHDVTREALKDHIVARLGKTMRPKAIHAVPALPKTRSAKIVRGVIRRVYLGLALGDLTSVENPDALTVIKGMAASVSDCERNM